MLLSECASIVGGRALIRVGVKPTNYWPGVNGESMALEESRFIRAVGVLLGTLALVAMVIDTGEAAPVRKKRGE